MGARSTLRGQAHHFGPGAHTHSGNHSGLGVWPERWCRAQVPTRRRRRRRRRCRRWPARTVAPLATRRAGPSGRAPG